MSPVAAILGVVLLLVVVAATLATRQLVRDQERRLLDERADEVAALLGAAFQGTGATLQSLGIAWSVTGPDQVARFDELAAPLAPPGTAVAIVGLDGTTATPLAAVGDLAPVDRSALLAQVDEAGGLVGGVLTAGGRSWLAMARPVAGQPGVAAVFESPIAPQTPLPRNEDSAFSDIRGALYAAPTADAAQLVFTTDATVPLTGDVVTRTVDLGGDRPWMLVAGSAEPLAGTLAGRLQWIVLAGGLLVTGLAVAVAGTLARRRRYAEDQVARRTHELRQREATLAAVFEASPDALQILDGDGTIRLASRTVGEQLGGNPAELVGRRVEDLVHPDDWAEVVAALEQVRSGGGTVSVEYRARADESGWRVLESKLACLPAEGTSPGAVVAGTRDVTERSRLLQELRLARASAESANRSKDEFLSRMSHELRTPLNAVLGFAQLLDMEATTEGEREAATHIIKAGHHLLALIDEVLDISRIETGHMALSVEPVSVADVITEVLALTRSLAVERGIRLPAGPSGSDACFVRADRQRMKQVLLNLVVNGIKYNRHGGAVTITTVPTPDGKVRVTVADTGAGIDASNLDRLFTPFERLGAEQSTVEGTGLGLALSKRLVEAMGGGIGVQSQPGDGTSFWIELDRTDVPAMTEPVVEPVDVADVEAMERTVLYIEDNLSNIQLVERIVERRPHVRLLVALQGQLGVELARQHQPDLVLVDLNLPDIDGETVVRRLRAEPRTRGAHIVVLSADATPGQVARLRAAGADDYLTKPFDVPRFLRIVEGTAGDGPVAEPVTAEPLG